MLTEKQRKVPSAGVKYERRTQNWLKKHGFKLEKSFRRPHAGHFDITAIDRKGKKWIIEVKGGENPSLNIQNFLKMAGEKGFRNIGLAIVAKNEVYLLQYKKMAGAAYKAWRKRK